MALDKANSGLAKAKLDVIENANKIVDSLEKDQKEAEEKASKEAEGQVL